MAYRPLSTNVDDPPRPIYNRACYRHRLFANDQQRRRFLANLGRYVARFVDTPKHILRRRPRPTFPAVPKRIIGRRDFADFPELGLRDIAVKVDTGAYTSAIHCHHIKVKHRGDGTPVLTFKLLDPTHADYNGRAYELTAFRTKRVRSSNGKAESRYLIKTKIHLFGRDYPIELSLSERGEMRFPVLIGRKLLMNRFIVDSAATDLSWAAKKIG